MSTKTKRYNCIKSRRTPMNKGVQIPLNLVAIWLTSTGHADWQKCFFPAKNNHHTLFLNQPLPCPSWPPCLYATPNIIQQCPPSGHDHPLSSSREHANAHRLPLQTDLLFKGKKHSIKSIDPFLSPWNYTSFTKFQASFIPGTKQLYPHRMAGPKYVLWPPPPRTAIKEPLEI